jgi:hypothetical protein
MKDTINQLVKLANEYAAFAKKIRLSRSTHNDLKEGISVYFGESYDTSSVRFRNKVEICLYANKIEFPYNISEEKLQETLDHAEKVLQSWKSECDPKIEKEKNTAKEIEALKNRLAELEK